MTRRVFQNGSRSELMTVKDQYGFLKEEHLRVSNRTKSRIRRYLTRYRQ